MGETPMLRMETNAVLTRRLRVLLSAFSFSPVGGSEPAVGWQIASRLAQHHDVVVLCSPGIQDRSRRRDIEQHIQEKGLPAGLSVEFIEPPAVSRFLQRDNRNGSLLRGLYYAGYAAWQRAAYRRALALHRERPFDLTHQLTFSGFREPGYLWKIPAPFVWGPIGGAYDLPWRYFPMLSWRDRVFYGARSIGNSWQKRAAWRSRRAARVAKHLWVNSESARQLVEDAWGRRATMLPETGTSQRPQGRVRKRDIAQPLRVVWSGLHIGLKALPILLHAMSSVPAMTLTVLGDGAATAQWKALARQLGVSDRIEWKGMLAHEEAIDEMGRADVLAFTSLQEGTPHVVLEALSLGMPVICHDACGMGMAVDERCGIKVAMDGPGESVRGFVDALRRVAGEEGFLEKLSAGALERSEELSWDRKVGEMLGVYERVVGLNEKAVPHPGPLPEGEGDIQLAANL